MTDVDAIDDRVEIQTLVANLKSALPQLEQLLEECSGHWGYEDPIYRFYHQSFKVYALQRTTKRIVSALQAIAPDRHLNEWFVCIVAEGTEKVFTPEHNSHWLQVTRPIVEAFFHSRYFLEMAVRYGRQLSVAPQLLPSGWAALLYLYGLR